MEYYFDRDIYLFYFLFFLERKFPSMVFASDDSFLSSDHSFWCIQKLNPKYLIQLLETLPVELTEIIYFFKKNIYIYIYIIFSSQSGHKTY